MKKLSLIDLSRQAIIAAVYVVLVFIFHFLSFEAVQIRIAEILLILVFFDKKSIIGLTLGVFISNLFSPLLLYDITFGVLASVISILLMIIFNKKPYIALLFPAIINGLIVGSMLYLLSDKTIPFYLNVVSVFTGEFIITYIIGLPTYYILKKLDFKDIYFFEQLKR